jgi:serine/threonine protein kinase
MEAGLHQSLTLVIYLSLQVGDGEHALREAWALGLRLSNHPSIIRLLGVIWEEHEGAPSMTVLEYAPGMSLRGLITRRGVGMLMAEIVEVGLQACTGLDYMHRRGVRHRDLHG